MLTSNPCEKHVANLQCHDPFNARLAIVHIYRAVEDCENFLTIVDMPFVWLVGPVKAHGGSVHVSDVVSAPGASGGEVLAADNSHWITGLEQVVICTLSESLTLDCWLKKETWTGRGLLAASLFRYRRPWVES